MTDLETLRSELDEFAQPKKKKKRSAREERIIAGFEEIQRFVDENGRRPEHGEDREIFERLYTVRLARICELEECRDLLAPIDHQGLLDGAGIAEPASKYDMDEDELRAELEELGGADDIRDLKHVRKRSEINVAEEIAQREKCDDFDQFALLFEQVEKDLSVGVRKSLPFKREAGIEVGNFFILGGQFAYVSEVGDAFRAPNGERDARLRVIYANGTESNLLMRSLKRALYKDEAGRRISDPVAGPLFGDELEDDDVESGTVYVLRSLSGNQFVAEHRELVHKIGVTGGDVRARVSNAAKQATYLLADVEIVATYKLTGINRTKLEHLLHKIFAGAQLDLTINDRFGNPVKPREWFLVPFTAIDEAIERIKKGTIGDVTYDPQQARFVSSGE